MAQPVSFKYVFDIGFRRNQIATEYDWRYLLFFEFLQYSPSYRLAHNIAVGRIDRKNVLLPKDFDVVEQTYAAFGPVYRIGFDVWWVKRAQFRFGVPSTGKPRSLFKIGYLEETSPQQLDNAKDALTEYLIETRQTERLSASMVLAIPFSDSKSKIIQDIKKLLDVEFSASASSVKTAQYTLERNKIRERTIRQSRTAVIARSARPNSTLYILGKAAKLARGYEIRPSDTKSEAFVRRRTMEMIVSRHLRRAWLLAENAARGKFPSFDHLVDEANCKKFDNNQLHKQFLSYLDWMEKEVKRRKDVAKNRKSHV